MCKWTALLSVVFGCSLVSTAHAGTSLDAIMESLHGAARQDVAGTAQARQVDDAIQASPALKRRLHDLAAKGAFSAIRIVADAQAPVVNNQPRAGAAVGTEMVLTRSLLQALRDYRGGNALPWIPMPNNTTFVLGHFSHHLRTRKAMEKAMTQFDEQATAIARSPDPGHDDTGPIQTMMARKLENEADAWIQGWNDTLDAGTQAHGHDAKAVGEVLVGMSVHLRYRKLLEQALELPEAEHPRILNTGIAMDAHNRAALVKALQQIPLTDID